MTKKLKQYCCSKDISQDYPVEIREYKGDDQDWCGGFIFEDDGSLMEKLKEAKGEFWKIMWEIEKLAKEKAIDEKPR